MGTNLKPLPKKEILLTNHHAIVLACWFTGIKYVKKLFKRLEARSGQLTAKEGWSDNIVNCYLIKMDLTCDRKPLPYIDIKPTDLSYITRK